MNYLAHIYLADHLDEKVLLGNFLGDFIKKAAEKNYEKAIVEGVHMHRRLDSFTDSHPVFLTSRRRVSSSNRRYAGVLIDMFYDHYLAKNWEDYSPVSLEKYAEHFYDILRRNTAILPDKLQGLIPYLINENWLTGYRKLSGMELAVNNIARRFANSRRPMNKPIDELRNNYGSLEQDFKVFFPQIVNYARTFQI
jgi:acyl carrier protein phosphodiesterase